MRRFRRCLVVCSCLAAAAAPAAPLVQAQAQAQVRVEVQVFEAAGDLATVTGMRDAFRAAVGGGTTAGAHGSFGGLRREIHWDGVPDVRADPAPLPGNFFNVNSPRGAVLSTPGAGFLFSADPGQAAAPAFGFADRAPAASASACQSPAGTWPKRPNSSSVKWRCQAASRGAVACSM